MYRVVCTAFVKWTKWKEKKDVRRVLRLSLQYGIKKREVVTEEAAVEEASEGSLTRPKKAVPAGCGDEEEEEESIMDTVMKYLPGPLQDMLKK